jgi:hypothetical protein
MGLRGRGPDRAGFLDSYFSRVDTNKDGKLSKEEIAEAAWKRMSSADADHDNALTKSELQSHFAKMMRGARRGAGRAERKPGDKQPPDQKKPSAKPQARPQDKGPEKKAPDKKGAQDKEKAEPEKSSADRGRPVEPPPPLPGSARPEPSAQAARPASSGDGSHDTAETNDRAEGKAGPGRSPHDRSKLEASAGAKAA